MPQGYNLGFSDNRTFYVIGNDGGLLGAPVTVTRLAINSMDTVVYADESFRNMRRRAETDKFTFPYLHDARQAVSRDFQAEHTPQTNVIWKEDAQWKIKYSGAVDDNGAEPGQLKKAYVARAADDLLAGKPVANPQTESFGCAIFFTSSCSCLQSVDGAQIRTSC